MSNEIDRPRSRSVRSAGIRSRRSYSQQCACWTSSSSGLCHTGRLGRPGRSDEGRTRSITATGFRAAIISCAVHWHFRFNLSLLDIEELLFERGIVLRCAPLLSCLAQHDTFGITVLE